MSRGSELSQKKPEKPEKERVQGVKDSRGQVVLLESFFKTKRGMESRVQVEKGRRLEG